jgi:hypothetical protein
MKKKINEEALCVLKKDQLNHIVIDYVDIVNPLRIIVEKLSDLCDKPRTTLLQIIDFLQNNIDFDQLTAHYRYCDSLRTAYQGFGVNNQDFIKDITQRNQFILDNKRKNPDNFNYEEAINELKTEIKGKYILWSKAFAINNTYKLCRTDKSILTFSHRINGWSNPVYQLTPNFSVEIKTNFGYGNASYFYTKLRYKNIDLTPFSEWVDYEFAHFSEIIRYTQSHILMNEYWLEAMEFSRDACNLSLTNEVIFIEKYVVAECEKMVSGLEEILNKDHFTFKKRDKSKYSVDKKGHVLVEFRGEKISGALDFIAKIIEFDEILTIKTFISRIEECNRKIQPILVEEAKILSVKIENLTKNKNELHEKYNEVVKIHSDFKNKRNVLKDELISKGELDANAINTKKLTDAFICKHPDYPEFKEEYNRVTESYRILIEQIQNNTGVRDNIVSYDEKIKKHFENHDIEEFFGIEKSISYRVTDNIFKDVRYSNYLEFFLKNLDFAKTYISIHYPLTYQFIIDNWNFLEPGIAHYCVYISDIDGVYPSTFGLCYNKNIRWNSKLKSRYDYGFSNPYMGYIDGTGIGPVEYEEALYLDDIIPLNVSEEIKSRNIAYISYWYSAIMPYLSKEDRYNSEPDLINADKIFEELSYLNFTEFKKKYEDDELLVLLNESIWDNTLSYIIDDNFCEIIINEIKKHSQDS